MQIETLVITALWDISKFRPRFARMCQLPAVFNVRNATDDDGQEEPIIQMRQAGNTVICFKYSVT